MSTSSTAVATATETSNAGGTTLARTIPVPPERALAALGHVLRAAPFALSLADTVGGHPLHGGVLRFVVPARGGLAGSGSAWAPVGTDAARRTIDLSLVSTGAASTEIRMTARLPRGRALALLAAALDAVARHAISETAFGPPPSTGCRRPAQ
jgi:hypothetical protein